MKSDSAEFRTLSLSYTGYGSPGLGFILSCAIFLTSTPATSQAIDPYTSSDRIHHYDPAEVPSGPHLSSANKASITLDNFALCIVRTERKEVIAALNMNPSLASSKSRLENLASSDCLINGTLSFGDELFRGALYRSLYKLKPSDHFSIELFKGSYDDSNCLKQQTCGIQYRVLLSFASCVVQHDYNDSKNFVLGDPGSESENRAWNGLVTVMSLCIDNGTKVTIGRESLSGLLAEVLYRGQ